MVEQIRLVVILIVSIFSVYIAASAQEPEGPDYRARGEGGRPEIAGYTATNVIEVRINDLVKVGQIIDVAMRAGANSIHRLLFTVQNEEKLRAQALREAAVNAKANAEALAAALGLRIVRVLLVTESGPAFQPIRELALRSESSAPQTPIDPGAIEVRATVTLAVEIAQ
jgi:uncharacterized protein YggE